MSEAPDSSSSHLNSIAMPQMYYYPNTARMQSISNGRDVSMSGMLEDDIMGVYNNGHDGFQLNLDDNSMTRSYDSAIAATARTNRRMFDDMDTTGDSNKVIVDRVLDEVGAGPPPTGFGTQSMLQGGSTLTEFTKRRNWSQRVVEELKDFLHVLTPDGKFIYVSPSTKPLTGYSQGELINRFIVDFIHPDDSGIFVREFNESIATGNPLRFFYRFRKADGIFTIFESHGHPHLTSQAAAFGPSNAAGFCRGFFMMARPYPTKNAALLDSFLEHKIENERLSKRIADLKQEQFDEDEDTRRHLLKKQEGHSDLTPSTSHQTTSSESAQPNADVLAMPPPAKPILGISLTRQNLADVTASSAPDSIKDKMARYEGATHSETIEMLTGLRYQDGERSVGISTGDMSPTLIRGDAGIAIPVDKDGRANEKKKKLKIADEYVCTDCGTLDSPEWRKGPSGPKTLCNACGLRWTKKEKRKTSNGARTANVAACSTTNT